MVPIQKGITLTVSKIEDSLLYFKDTKSVSLENQALSLKVDQLEEENRKLGGLAEENNRLREILGIKDKFENYQTITSRIIAKDPGNWFNYFTIDKGIADGVGANMAVLTPKGLVGQVVSATRNSARVMAIIDEGSSISARVEKSRDLVIVRGQMDLKDNGLAKLIYIPAGLQLQQGDIIETSGMGGIFPAGIMIGKVEQYSEDKPQLMRDAIIRPAVNFKNLEEVIVLKNK